MWTQSKQLYRQVCKKPGYYSSMIDRAKGKESSCYNHSNTQTAGVIILTCHFLSLLHIDDTHIQYN